MPKITVGSYQIHNLTLICITLTIVLSSLAYYVRANAFQGLQQQDPNIQFSAVVVPAIQLVPNRFYFYPWTLFTEPFVQTSILKFLISLPVFFFGVDYLESNWNWGSSGSNSASANGRFFNETGYYLFVVTIATSIICVILKCALVLIAHEPAEILAKPLNYGIFAIIMSFIVVVKQRSPEYNIKLFKVIKFRLKRLPFIVLSTALFVSLLFTRSVEPFASPLFTNFYFSWCYLRYYQISYASDILPSTLGDTQTSTVRGDASDTFAFVQFFPDSWQRYMKPVSRFFYHTSVFLGLFRPFNDDDIESSNLRTIQRLNQNNALDSIHGTSNSDRRKRIALKVLEQRVGKQAGDSTATVAPATEGTSNQQQ